MHNQHDGRKVTFARGGMHERPDERRIEAAAGNEYGYSATFKYGAAQSTMSRLISDRLGTPACPCGQV